jgi:hypothetical protein
MGACGVFIVVLAIGVVGAWIVLTACRWLFGRAVVVAGDAKLITECTTCKYSLAGLGTAPTCPECNTHHPTIYTTHSRTERRVRHELFWHWVVSAVLCLAFWGFMSYVFPPVTTAVMYWSKGWSAAPRIEQLMASHVYPWYPPELAFVMFLAWLASCALSLRCKVRTLCIAHAIGSGITFLVCFIAAFKSRNWVDDWYTYFWDSSANAVTATIGTISVVTLVACMLIDLAGHANRAAQSEPQSEPQSETQTPDQA